MKRLINLTKSRNLQKHTKIIWIIFIAYSLFFTTAQTSVAQLNSGIKLFDMPKTAQTTQKIAINPCENLEKRSVISLKEIIKIGHLPAETSMPFKNLINNASAMALNKCDKGVLYNYINTHLTFDDPLYFQLNGLL